MSMELIQLKKWRYPISSPQEFRLPLSREANGEKTLAGLGLVAPWASSASSGHRSSLGLFLPSPLEGEGRG
jgi:hypothetical protein